MADLEQWYQEIVGGTAGPQLKQMASLGLVPFPPERQLHVLAVLAADLEETIRAQALTTTQGMPAGILEGAAGERSTPRVVLENLFHALPEKREIIRHLAVNPGTPDGILIQLASSPVPDILELLVRNQDRLRRSVDLLAALAGNAHLPAHLAGAVAEEMDRHRASRRAQFDEELAKEEMVPEVHFDEILTVEHDNEDSKLPPPKRTEIKEKRAASIFQMIRTMTPGEKILLALRGNKEARFLLIREASKIICLKVLENPRLTDSEVEMYAKMTNVSEDVLRTIANGREWMRKYGIIRALINNPRLSIGISLPLLPKLNDRDLTNMGRNRNVPEALRTSSIKLVKLRAQRK